MAQHVGAAQGAERGAAGHHGSGIGGRTGVNRGAHPVFGRAHRPRSSVCAALHAALHHCAGLAATARPSTTANCALWQRSRVGFPSAHQRPVKQKSIWERYRRAMSRSAGAFRG